MHRDLKLPNILINLPTLSIDEWLAPGFDVKEHIKKINFVNDDAVPLEVKIGDLGFARELEES